ncbi:hypothetical protein K8942_00020 [Candidatus Peribacteria bacterium]|nr:MAG: hypothetical protein K8942_00020 [Candidatus Peribacteria bacterium]
MWFLNQARVGPVVAVRLKNGLAVLGDDVAFEDRECGDVLRAGCEPPDCIVIVAGSPDSKSTTPIAAVYKSVHCPILFLHNGHVGHLNKALSAACGDTVTVIDVSRADEEWKQSAQECYAAASAPA